jgi:PAS domain S-box-containing protein
LELGEASEFEAFYPEPLNLWLRVQCYPAHGGIVIFFRDLTEKKLAREELRLKREETERQHAEIESLYRTAPIGLALFDTKDFRYLRLNDRQAAFFGLKPEQVVGRTVTEMANIDGLKELFDQVLQGKPVVSHPLEGTLINDPNAYRYWLVSYFPVYGTDGSIQAITAASLEVTQQKMAEQALIQSEKLAVVGRLASSIAHEINNPLEAITNLLYLARNSENIADIHRHLHTAEIELRRVSAITSQTLRFHKQATRPQDVTVKQLMQSVLSIYQGRIANSRVRITQRTRTSQPVRCFEGEIRQIISNLIGNALDAMSENGHLFLRSRLGTNWINREHGIVITIADTGVGMSAETMAKLFNPFFTTKGMTGTGLGLWVSKEIIGRHRGLLRVRSSQSATHHGTVFNIFLPFDAVVR